MAAQKRKKNLLTEIFGTFESALTQNSTNQEFQLSWFFRIVWKTVRKSKIHGAPEKFFHLKMISNLAPQIPENG